MEEYGVAGVVRVVLLVALVVPTNLFPILYAAKSPWRATPTGKALMFTKVALALLVDQSAFLMVWVMTGHDVDGWHRWVQAVLFALINLSSWTMLLVLLGAQRADRRSADRGTLDRTTNT